MVGRQRGIEILIVEDNEADAELLLLMLHRALPGVVLRTRGTLAEALELLSERRVELAFLDLGLPDAEDLEGLSRLRRVDETMAIVVLTGRDDEELATRALNAGAQDYLVKGHVPQDVIKRTVRHALARREHLMLKGRLERAQHVNSLGLLVSSMVHQLQEPASVIEANHQLELMRLDHLWRAIEQGDRGRIQRTIQEFRDALVDGERNVGRIKHFLGRMSSLIGTPTSMEGPCSTHHMVHEALARFADERYPHVELNLVLDTDVEFEGMSEHVITSMHALISNANEAMKRPAKHRLTLYTVNEADGVRLCVRDSGTGFDEEIEGRAFDPFVSLKPNHVGLGLTLARETARAHRGRLTIMSEEGNGSQVDLWLPYVRPRVVTFVDEPVAELTHVPNSPCVGESGEFEAIPTMELPNLDDADIDPFGETVTTHHEGL